MPKSYFLHTLRLWSIVKSKGQGRHMPVVYRPFGREISFTSHALSRCEERDLSAHKIAIDLAYVLDGTPRLSVHRRRLNGYIVVYERTIGGAEVITVWRKY